MQVAAEVFLSVDAVKTHLRTLFQKFHIEDLPQNQKRVKLVERAFALGIITRRDL
jgi:DNA-binding NarL/FixJ family response regulator